MTAGQEPIQRKVQLTGGTTYTVSLPKSWAEAHDIGTGTPVDCFVYGDRLLITKNGGDDRHETRIDARSRDPDDLAWTVSAAYVAGVDTVEIEGVDTRDRRRAVRSAIADLVGFEIDEADDETVVVRTMIAVDNVSPEQTLMQMEMTTLSMHEEAIDAVLSGDAERAHRIERLDDDVDRQFALLSREFQRSLFDISGAATPDRLTAFDYFTAARQIERIADHAEKIAGVVDRMETTPPTEVNDELRSLGKRSRDLVRDALRGLVNPNDAALEAVLATADDVLADAEALDRTLYDGSYADGYSLAIVLDSTVRTTEYAVNVAEAGLQASIRNTHRSHDDN